MSQARQETTLTYILNNCFTEVLEIVKTVGVANSNFFSSFHCCLLTHVVIRHLDFLLFGKILCAGTVQLSTAKKTFSIDGY